MCKEPICHYIAKPKKKSIKMNRITQFKKKKKTKTISSQKSKLKKILVECIENLRALLFSTLSNSSMYVKV